MGHKAIFCNETKKKNGQQLAALDMVMDDIYMDIRSVTGRGWYSNIFVKKNDQLRRYNSRSDVEEKADALCLYFHDPNLFDETKMKKSINLTTTSDTDNSAIRLMFLRIALNAMNA